MGTSAAWTEERRIRQEEWIRRWRPWTRSTGPKSQAGKSASSRNAVAFRNDPEMRVAYSEIQTFLKTGRMTPELGAILLKAELSGVTCDPIFEDMGDIAGEERGDREWR